MLDIHLFGKFRKLTPNPKATEDSKLSLAYIEGETMRQLLARLGITPKEIGELFIDFKVVELDTIIPHENARISIFPEGMVLLCGGQHLKGHGFIRKPVKEENRYF